MARSKCYNPTTEQWQYADRNPLPTGLEETANKVTSLSAQSTDTQYPSAKCVYDIVGDVESALAALIGGNS